MAVKKKTRRQRKKRSKEAENVANGVIDSAASKNIEDDDDDLKVEIEYVPATVDVSNDPTFSEFSKVFQHFQFGTEPEKTGEMPERKKEEAVKDIFADHDDDDDDDEQLDENKDSKLSKKKLRKLSRMTVAELKRFVDKPEVVEWVDVTAPDPMLLVKLKSTRNTAPVPRHWGQKRKYLQNKRGIEKPPFKLPEFIRATGIQEMREAVREKEDSMNLKQRTRERVQPKMGKIEINYEKLHDAFFRWQTKPDMTRHGEMYYEGKEFETKVKERKPGHLSEELKAALNMPPGAPPPWLIAMQRYGPPPSYPNMKIPGLNAPVPPGAQWGFFPGGWGAPPIDEHGRPLYGDIFSEPVPAPPSDIVAPIEKDLWGELEEEEYEEEEEEQDEEEEEVDEDGMETPSGVSSVISTGLETPDAIQLRKERAGDETPVAPIPTSTEPKQLYQVLPQKEAKLTGMMGTQHVYELPGMKKAAEGIDVALDPSEMENLDEETIKAKYEQKIALEKEDDFSDMVAEHAIQQSKKRKKAQESKSTKKAKEFKF